MIRRRPARVNVKALVILALAVVLLIGAAAVAYVVQKRLAARRAMDAGRAALQEEDWTEACKQFRVYLAKYPDDGAILGEYAEANLAVRPLGSHNVSAAIGAYRRLLRQKPGDDQLCERLAELYYSVRDFKEAAYVARQRLETDPADEDALLWLGRALAGQGQDDQAAEALAKLAETHPQQSDAYVLLSTIAARAGSAPAREKALQWLNRGVENNPQSASLLAARARFQRTVNRDRESASADLEAAGRFAAEDPEILLILAEEWMNLDELDRAGAYVDRLKKLDVGSLDSRGARPEDLQLGECLLTGRLALLRGDRAGGAEVADGALAELDGGRRRAFLPLAIDLYVTAGRVESARRCLEEYGEPQQDSGVRSAGRDDDLVLLGAVVAQAEGRWYEVINDLEPFVARSPNRAQAWMLLANAYERTGQPLRAADALERYLNLAREDFATALRLARIYTNRDASKALRFADLAERLQPTSLAAQLARIEAQLNVVAVGTLGADILPRLLAELKELRESHPQVEAIGVLLAQTAAREGRPDEAIAELERVIEGGAEDMSVAAALVQYCKHVGRLDQALEVCQGLVTRHPDSAAPRALLAHLLATLDRQGEARRTLEQAAEELGDEQRVAARLALAEYLVEYGPRNEGLAQLDAIAAEQPDNVRLRIRLLSFPEVQQNAAQTERLLGELRGIEGESGLLWRIEQAKAWLRGEDFDQRHSRIEELLNRCIKADPAWSEPVLVLGSLYQRSGRPKEAETVYRRLLDADPTRLDLAGRLLALLAEQKRFAEADAILKRIPGRPPALSPHRVDIAIGRGEYDLAVEELSARASADAADAASRVVLARLMHAVRGDAEAALRLLEEAEAADPDLLTVFSTRAAILRAQGREDEAKATIDGQVARRGDFAVYQLRAEYCTVAGLLEQAEQDYTHLTTFAGREADGYAALGGFYTLAGRPADAVTAWRAGLRLDPQHHDLTYLLVKALVESSDPPARQEGRRMLNDLLAAAPEDVNLLALRAAVLVNEGGDEPMREAEGVLKQLVQLDPGNVGAHRFLAQLARARGELERAGEWVSRGLAVVPQNPELMIMRAGLEAELGHPIVARAIARSVLDVAPNNLDARNLLAELTLRTGDIDGALRLSNESLARDPTNEVAHVVQAQVLEARGEREQAIEALETYCRSDAGARSLKARLALATLYKLQGDAERAREQLDEAESLAPADAAVCRARLQWLAWQRRFDDIVAEMDRRGAKPRAEPSVGVTAASLLAEAGADRHLHAAGRLFEQVAEAHPKRLDVWLGIAQVKFRLGDLAGTERAYRQVLALDAYHRQALNDLAWILSVHLGNHEEALEFAAKGAGHYPNDPHLMDTRGVILTSLGRLEEARADLERCVALAEPVPATRANALFHLGRVLVKQGEPATAKPRLEEALAIDREHEVFSDAERAEIAALVNSAVP